ncbi:alpha-glucosidase C-terminal domain-containing protein [Raoultella planticola]
MIQLRHKIRALVYGAYQDLNAQDNTVYACTRILGRERYLVVVNFKEQPVRYLLPSSDAIEQVVIETNQHNDTPQGSTSIALSPWQAACINCINQESGAFIYASQMIREGPLGR